MFSIKKSLLLFSILVVAGIFVYAAVSSHEVRAQSDESKLFVLWADTHYGNIEGDGSVNDIATSVSAIKKLNPDFILHAGDVTERGETAQFRSAGRDFNSILRSTGVERIWITLGGSHDGYSEKDQYGGGWNGNFVKREGDFPSLYYTIKKGNNVFIFLNIVQGNPGWDNDWGDPQGHFLPQNVLDYWLEPQLAKYNDTENNVFIIVHSPITGTNAFTDDWARMKEGAWNQTSIRLLELMSKYRVDVVINGHVHIDPDKGYSNSPTTSYGNVLLAGYRSDLPSSTTFLHATDVAWEHGQGTDLGLSTYPSLMYFNLINGQDYFTLNAMRTDTNQSVGITYNDEHVPAMTVDVPLSYPVTGMESANNSIDFYEQGWDVYQFSIEDTFQWYKDSEGLRVSKNNTWIKSVWDFTTLKTVTNVQTVWSGNQNSKLSNKYFCSSDNMDTWRGPYSNLADVGPCRFFMVKTTFSVNPGEVYYIYDMKPQF